MHLSEFTIGSCFHTATGRWRVTDVGSRVVVAIQVDPIVTVVGDKVTGRSVEASLTEDEAMGMGLIDLPPYQVPERVFDEYDQEGCSPGAYGLSSGGTDAGGRGQVPPGQGNARLGG